MGEPGDMGKDKGRISKAADNIGKFTRKKTTPIVEKSNDIVDSTKEPASDTTEKLRTNKSDPYEAAITEYNNAFTLMSDKGLALLRQRERSTDLIELVELLVNSVANTPKSFEVAFDEIDVNKADFLEAEEFARQELEAARKSATLAGTGITAGAAVASMAPSAALCVATTFGTASTGTAISTLSGAAATKAALAWLGGGTLAAGGGGTAAGSTFLALAGPVGWTFAGATLLVSISLFAKKKFTNREAKQEALTALKQNTARVVAQDVQIDNLLQRTTSLREILTKSYREALPFFGDDFLMLPKEQQFQLAALVNNTKACAAQLSHLLEQEGDDE